MIILLSLEKLLIWNVSIYQIGVETLRVIFWGSNTYSAHAISTVGVMWFPYCICMGQNLIRFITGTF